MPTILINKKRLESLFLGGEPTQEIEKMTNEYAARHRVQERARSYAKKEFDRIYKEMFDKTGLELGMTYKVRTFQEPDVDYKCILENYIPGVRGDRYWIDLVFKTSVGNTIWTGLNIVNNGFILSINGDEMYGTLMHVKGESKETDELIKELHELNMDITRRYDLSKEVTSDIQKLTGIKFGKTVCKFTLPDGVCEAVPSKIILGSEDGFILYLEYTGDFRPVDIQEEDIQSVTW